MPCDDSMEIMAPELHKAMVGSIIGQDHGRQVRVGVATVVRRQDGHVLMGLRKGSHGAGTWGLPGGRIEVGEDPMATALRELQEETGILPTEIVMSRHKRIPYLSSNMPDTDHWITLFFEAQIRIPLNRDIVVIEHEKQERWEWFPPQALPNPLFGALVPIVLLPG